VTIIVVYRTRFKNSAEGEKKEIQTSFSSVESMQYLSSDRGEITGVSGVFSEDSFSGVLCPRDEGVYEWHLCSL